MTKENILATGQSGRDFYSDKYKDPLHEEAKWLDLTANGKVDSIQILLNRNQITPENILELGCGTGSIIRELEKRRIATEYFGIDYSKEAISYLCERSSTIRTDTADITKAIELFDKDHFDILILSHVLEHLEDPSVVLKSLSSISFSYLICEVPLENLFFGKMKSRFIDRSNHAAGHVQFFNKRTFRALLAGADISVFDDRVYAPIFDLDVIKSRYKGGGGIRYAHKLLTERYLPLVITPLWTRVYHAHYTTLSKSKS